ncbi:MAG: hypothetical protein ABIK47_01370 [candidate division WOR-3 bacterium]
MSRAVKILRLAARISTKLKAYGIDTVLSGGSCVTIYARGKYVTRDLDFVLAASYPEKIIASALAELGYHSNPKVSGAFTNPKEETIIDIRPPPPAIGGEPIRQPQRIITGGYQLTLLSPTDCVKDRLAHFFFFNDRQGLEQAILVATNQKVNIREVRRWAEAEGMAERYREFYRALLRQRRLKSK